MSNSVHPTPQSIPGPATMMVAMMMMIMFPLKDEKNQVLVSNVWIRQVSKQYYLTIDTFIYTTMMHFAKTMTSQEERIVITMLT